MTPSLNCLERQLLRVLMVSLSYQAKAAIHVLNVVSLQLVCSFNTLHRHAQNAIEGGKRPILNVAIPKGIVTDRL